MADLTARKTDEERIHSLLASLESAVDEICVPYSPPQQNEVDRQRTQGLRGKIGSFPEGREILRILDARGIEIKFDNTMTTTGKHETRGLTLIDGQWKALGGETIYLNPKMSDAQLLTTFFHEARHARQFAVGAAFVSKNCSPADVIWNNRIIEADAQATAVIQAYQLKLAGDSSAFDEGKTHPSYANMFNFVEELASKDPSTLKDGWAKQMAFEIWFKNDSLIDLYDIDCMENIWPSLKLAFDSLDNRKHPKQRLNHNDMDKLRAIDNHKNYLASDNGRKLDDEHYVTPKSATAAQQLIKLMETWLEPKQNKPARNKNLGHKF